MSKTKGKSSTVPDSTEVQLSSQKQGKHRFGKVVNAPTAQNNGGFETRVTASVHAPADKTAGANATMAANVFEQRVTQESGQH